jgi:hypothetical protein
MVCPHKRRSQRSQHDAIFVRRVIARMVMTIRQVV